MYAAKEITTREWMTARTDIQAQATRQETALARVSHSDALAGLVGHGDGLHVSWAGPMTSTPPGPLPVRGVR